MNAVTKCGNVQRLPEETEPRHPNPCDNKLHIFVSHKLIDREIAQSVKHELEEWGGKDRVDVFLSEDIAHGEDWVDQIHTGLETADWLFLLYTDPTSDWDWCLYETGFFAAKSNGRSLGRLICLYPTNTTAPGPLTRWKPVEGTYNEIVKLLRRVFSDPPREGVPPVRTDVEGRWLTECAGTISSALKPPSEDEWFSKYITLTFTEDQTEAFREQKAIPLDVQVAGDGDSLRIFGLKERSWNWSDFSAQIPTRVKDNDWTRELTNELHKAINGFLVQQALPLFRLSDGLSTTCYRPVLHRLTHRAEGGFRIWVIFVHVQPADLDEMYQRLISDVKYNFPHVTIRFNNDGGRIADASACAEQLLEVSSLKDMDVREYVGQLESLMPVSQGEAFLAEQDLLLGKLFKGDTSIKAKVCMAFKSDPSKRYLPIITKYFAKLDARYVEVLYADVSSEAVEENGVATATIDG